MIDKLIRIAGYIAYGLFFAGFGGLMLAAIISLILEWLLQLIGFNITTADISKSIFGTILLLACMLFCGLLGVGVGVNITALLNKLFRIGK